MKPWRWNPHALTQLTGDRAVRILPPAEPVTDKPYDWQDDPELTTQRPNPIGFTVRSSELGSNWSAEYHLRRLQGLEPPETLTHPDERDWQEEQDARLLESSGDLSWDEARDIAQDSPDEEWFGPDE